jgi:hypothetical protein
MRVMVIVKANKETEAGVMPKRELLAAMENFNEELMRLLAVAGEVHAGSCGLVEARAI